MKKYVVSYLDGREEIMDQEEVEDLILELEGFERYDVNMINVYRKDGQVGKTVWTEEEGLFINI